VRELYRTIASSSAVVATRHLYHHPANAQPALRRALWGGERQPRFLAAFLLGRAVSTADAVAIQTELVPHLEDNATSGDALLAAHALYRLGHASRDALAAWRPSVDRQARSLIELILLDLDRPPRTREELVARSRLHASCPTRLTYWLNSRSSRLVAPIMWKGTSRTAVPRASGVPPPAWPARGARGRSGRVPAGGAALP
jgi:hypothetical protein